MIFHKSLSKKKGAAYSFFSGLSAAFVPAVLLTLFQMIFMAVLPAIEFINRDYQVKTTGSGQLSKDVYKFLIFGADDTQDITFIYFALGVMGIISILAAVRIFSFICDKRTVNVYYSLGIKRSTLFLSKYASGALLLCLSTAIPVILSYLINIIYLGASWQLSLVLLHIYCGISVFLLLCYSITSAVFSSVGTVSEAVVYSVAVLFAPTIVIFITEQIIDAFLPSSTLNMYISHFTDNGYLPWSSSDSLLEATSSYNPVLFFADDLLKFSCGMKSEDAILLSAVDKNWEFPNIFIHIIWFIIALSSCVVGALLFKRIKAENCGFLNTNKLLSNLTIFELCLFGSCLFISQIEWNGAFMPLALGTAAAFGLYIIAEIFLKRNFIRILKSLYKFAAHMAVIAIIFGICATGAFGYDTYIPDKAKVVSAEIAIPFSYGECSTMSMGYGSVSAELIRMYQPYRLTYMPIMTETSDIETVMKINREINSNETNDGTYCEIVIRYNYEDGRFSERKHILTSKEEIRSLFTLRGTKAYGKQIDTLFYETDRIEKIKKEANEYPYFVDETRIKTLCFDYDYSTVIARSPSLQENRTLDLTKEQFTTLKDAVYKDIMNTTSGEYYESTKAQIGVLSFDITPEARKIEGVNGYSAAYDTSANGENHAVVYEEGVTMVTRPELILPTEETEPEVLPGEEDNIGLPEENSPYKDEDNILYSGLGNLGHDSAAYDVIITENMTNTLSALASFGLSDCFKTEFTVESVSFCEYDSNKTFGFFYSNASTVHEFFAYPTALNEYYEYENDKNYVIEGNHSENIIKDKDKITELDSLMKLHEYTFNKGYFCLVKYTNGAYCVKYLSEEDAPEYVKNFNYTQEQS